VDITEELTARRSSPAVSSSVMSTVIGHPTY
jgi:hypothetical protein